MNNFDLIKFPQFRCRFFINRTCMCIVHRHIRCEENAYSAVMLFHIERFHFHTNTHTNRRR